MAADKLSPESLERYRIPDIPEAMYYIPDFITADEEQDMLEKIPQNRWVTLTHRRLQAWPARLTATNTLLASPGGLPPWLTNPAVDRIRGLEVLKDAPHGINHCLINEYLPGQGIMPHEDGEAYFPVVATVSLGGRVVLDVSEKGKGKGRRWRVLQEPRSLLLTTGSAYTDTLHGIADVERDEGLGPEGMANWDLLGEATRKGIVENGGCSGRTTRISLTFRDVKKVSSVGLKIFGKPR